VTPTNVSGCIEKTEKTMAASAEARMTSLMPYAPSVRWYMSST
jgi:hypothetical protein